MGFTIPFPIHIDYIWNPYLPFEDTSYMQHLNQKTGNQLSYLMARLQIDSNYIRQILPNNQGSSHFLLWYNFVIWESIWGLDAHIKINLFQNAMVLGPTK